MIEFYFTTDTSDDKPINGKFRHTRDNPELFTVILNTRLENAVENHCQVLSETNFKNGVKFSDLLQV